MDVFNGQIASYFTESLTKNQHCVENIPAIGCNSQWVLHEIPKEQIYACWLTIQATGERNQT